jgi:hypothetical protein
MAKNMTRRAFPRGGVRTRLPVTIYRRKASASLYESLRVGLVAYWPMNETASSGENVTVQDWTGRGNNLTSNNTVPSVAGIQGNGREFTAANSEYLAAAGANNDLKFADGRDWTIAGWIWAASWVNNTYLIANDASGNREILFSLSTGYSNSVACALGPGGAASGSVAAGSGLATNTWHQFIFTYKADIRRLRGRANNLDNETVTVSAGTLAQSANPLNFGRRQFSGANAHFSGRLDEVAKWDRVLTTAEMETLWNNGSGIDLRQ